MAKNVFDEKNNIENDSVLEAATVQWKLPQRLILSTFYQNFAKFNLIKLGNNFGLILCDKMYI